MGAGIMRGMLFRSGILEVIFARCLRRYVLPALLLLVPAHAFAATVDEVVASAARSWLMDWARQGGWPTPSVDVVVLPLRRPPPQCGQALQVAPLDVSQPARLRFSARCPDGSAQTYTVRAAVHTRALAVAAAWPAGKLIGKDDLRLADVDIAFTPDAMLNPDDVAGRTSQRPLRAGQVLQARFLKTGAGVRRGELVQIVSRHQAFQISAQGTAMEKGDGDALVRVRNGASGKLIMARVIGPGMVEPVLDAAP